MDYAWGQSGKEAFIPRLLAHSSCSQENPAALAKRPAAELWMGAHPKAPAQILGASGPQDLDEALASAPEHYLGPQVHQQGYKNLSFMFKILDAAEPLSIQAHPDRKLAQKLHRTQPQHYPDPYPKPELAVCIANMCALVGFQTIAEIQANLDRVPALARLCPPSDTLANASSEEEWLKQCYSSLMQSSLDEVEDAAHAHCANLEAERKQETDDIPVSEKMAVSEKMPGSIEDALFILFVKRYGFRDPGIFSAYFLNYVELMPGEAIFLAPNTPHSYIRGVILECMGASDNVVRAGLSQKYCDIPTLLEMLEYRPSRPQIHKPLAKQGSCEYSLPVPEFKLRCYETEASEKKHNRSKRAAKSYGFSAFQMNDLDRPSILLVLEQKGRAEIEFSAKAQLSARQSETLNLVCGDVIFLPGDLQARGFRLRLKLEQGTVYRALGPNAANML